MPTLSKKPQPSSLKKRAAPRRKSVVTPSVQAKGDIARAMFTRWDKMHRDPRPISWEKLQATLQENRLREAPLF
jgi:hypothetical protein